MTIKIVEFEGNKPAIAYTDYSAVYISTTLQGQQRRTAVKHEKAHIWLQHQGRRARLLKLKGVVEQTLWNTAADLEIAKHIYNDKDLAAIREPRSALANGISDIHVQQYPNAVYAEEFYEELLKSATVVPVSHDGDANDSIEGEAQASYNAPQALVPKARAEADKEEANLEQTASEVQAQKAIDGFQPPRPSMASLVDRYIGRGKVRPIKGYIRPSRRIVSSDMILRGKRLQVKSPRLTVYVDRSGSFTPSKTAASVAALHECLTKYRGRVALDVIYFADRLMLNDPGRGIGGTNYQPVVDQIAADRAELSIIITDEDSAEGVQLPRNMPNVVVVPVACSITSIGALLKAQHAPEVKT